MSFYCICKDNLGAGPFSVVGAGHKNKFSCQCFSAQAPKLFEWNWSIFGADNKKLCYPFLKLLMVFAFWGLKLKKKLVMSDLIKLVGEHWKGDGQMFMVLCLDILIRKK